MYQSQISQTLVLSVVYWISMIVFEYKSPFIMQSRILDVGFLSRTFFFFSLSMFNIVFDSSFLIYLHEFTFNYNFSIRFKLFWISLIGHLTFSHMFISFKTSYVLQSEIADSLQKPILFYHVITITVIISNL